MIEKNYFCPDLVIVSNMRIPQFIALLSLFLLPFVASGQLSNIDAALQKANVTEWGNYFSKTVELSIPDADDAYSAAQAVTILTDFFSKQGVKGYKRVHLSAPQQGRASYSIGDLYSAQGTYRLTMYFDASQKITEIRIQK